MTIYAVEYNNYSFEEDYYIDSYWSTEKKAGKHRKEKIENAFDEKDRKDKERNLHVIKIEVDKEMD